MRFVYPILLFSGVISPLVLCWYEQAEEPYFKTTTSFPASEFDAIALEIQSKALVQKFLVYMERDLFWRIWDARQTHDKEVVFGLALSVSEIYGASDSALRPDSGFVKSDAVAAMLHAKNGQDALRILRALRFFSTDFIKHMVAYVANSDAWFAAATLKMTEEHESRFGEHAAFLVAAAQLSYP